jgi:hypothetical protein
MFTCFSVGLASQASWIAIRENDRWRPCYCDNDDPSKLTLHIREDLNLIAYLLFGVIVMLGILGDILITRH